MFETIFSNFLGAFFGFLFAILVEVIVGKYNDKDIQEKVKESLEKELTEIKKSLLEKEHTTENPTYFRYQVVVWKTCVYSGYLFSVSGKPLYTSFIKIYTDIEFADNLEQRYFELLTLGDAKQSEIAKITENLNNERKTRRTKLIKDITEILGDEV